MRWVGWLFGLASAIGGPVVAQQPIRAAGTVLRPATPAPVPVGNVRTVLHRVGLASQGPIDTVVTDAGGRFRFEFRAESTATYLISATRRHRVLLRAPGHQTDPARYRDSAAGLRYLRHGAGRDPKPDAGDWRTGRDRIANGH